MTIRDELQAARDHLATVGLCKRGAFEDGYNEATSPCCLIAAVHVTKARHIESCIDALKAQLPDGGLVRFAERRGVGTADAVALFDRAIASVS